MPHTQVLEFDAVSKRLGNRPLFTGLTWSIGKEELVILKGANGSGKTTLLKMAASLISPDDGEIRIAGLLVRHQRIAAKRHFSYVSPDERSFYWKLSGWQNLRFFASLQSVSPSEFSSSVRSLAERFRMESDLLRPFQEYSSGMRQKLSLVRSFILRRPLFLMDEPDRHLDSSAIATLKELIDERRSEGSTFLIATASEQFPISGTIYQLMNGNIFPGEK